MPKSADSWRSVLFIPVTVEKFVKGATARGADAYILDLEDAVAPAEKPRARTLIESAAATIADDGADVLVRINRPMRDAVRDLEACVGPNVCTVVVPKVSGPEHVRLIGEMLGELEVERGLQVGSTGVIPVIEDQRGLRLAAEVASADPRVVGLSLGPEDFATTAGTAADAEALVYPTQAMVYAAREAGVAPVGIAGSIAEFRDLQAYRASAELSRRIGLVGAFCIHPAQVPVLNAAFAPSAEEVTAARALVAAFETGMAQGLGAVQHEGKMIDAPVVDRARALLALAQRHA